jgi:2-polyprenyl-6-methoxyphenol hydroxylase-like FAD-dependent oxidoreductase
VGEPAGLTAARLPGASLPSTAQVVLAGGGPVGLACAVELGRRGIGCLVIEPRETVSRARPRCKTVNARSMQHLRRWDIAGRLRDRAPLSPAWSSDAVFCTSLAGRELSRFTGVLGLVPDGDRFPELGQQAPQYLLEELLRDAVRELPACQLATGRAVTGVAQDEGGVRVTVTGPEGRPAVVTADYLVGCDGPRSVVRDRIDAAAGVPSGAVVRSTDPWTARMQLADRMRRGRVFLAGDAAHLNPPFGGHGLNTGLGDAVDLGWKLAATLDGWGGPALLDSYQAERRPIQERVIREATANMAVTSPELLADNLDTDDAAGERARRAAAERIQQAKRPEFHSLDLVLGVRIEDSPVIAREPDTGAQAGALLPHAWLGPGRSLYDELGEEFTLLVRHPDAGRGVIERAARTRGVPLRVLSQPSQDGPALALVRPDQYVAWAGDRAPTDGLALIDQIRGAG